MTAMTTAAPARPPVRRRRVDGGTLVGSAGGVCSCGSRAATRVPRRPSPRPRRHPCRSRSRSVESASASAEAACGGTEAPAESRPGGPAGAAGAAGGRRPSMSMRFSDRVARDDLGEADELAGGVQPGEPGQDREAGARGRAGSRPGRAARRARWSRCRRASRARRGPRAAARRRRRAARRRRRRTAAPAPAAAPVMTPTLTARPGRRSNRFIRFAVPAMIAPLSRASTRVPPGSGRATRRRRRRPARSRRCRGS